MTQLMLQKAAQQQEEKQKQPTVQQNVGALAAALGQRGFATPKSLI